MDIARTKKGDKRVLHELNRRVSLRKTHPNLFIALIIFSLTSIALSLNFFFSKPTFNPYGIDKEIVALVFFVMGSSKLIALTVYHNLKIVRLTVAVAIGVLLFWGISNTQQAFQGKSSFQLPILYIALALLQVPMLVEPRTNPMTSNGKLEEKR